MAPSLSCGQPSSSHWVSSLSLSRHWQPILKAPGSFLFWMDHAVHRSRRKLQQLSSLDDCQHIHCRSDLVHGSTPEARNVLTQSRSFQRRWKAPKAASATPQCTKVVCYRGISLFSSNRVRAGRMRPKETVTLYRERGR